MSVTFYPSHPDGRPLLRCACEPDTIELCAACRAGVNMSNVRAHEVLEHVGVWHYHSGGHMPARELLALLEAADPLPSEDAGTPDVARGERDVELGRRPGYIGDRVRELRVVCRLAGDGWVSWG
jgi:hypothetical protein